MIGPHLPALQVVIPLVGALLAALVRRPGPAWLIMLAASWLALLVACLLLVQVLGEGVISYRIGGWDPSIGIEYRVDVVNAMILVLVAGLAAIVAPFARASVAAEIAEDKIAGFYAVYLLALTGLLGIAITGDAFNAFVFLEISSLASYALIALGRDRRALVAAFQYLVMGTIGATFYVFGVGLLYVSTGTLNLGLMAERLAHAEHMRPVIAGLAFITVGIGLKLALFPLHVWLPNAYAYAPSTASVFLAGAATKVAIYLFARFAFSVFGVDFVFAKLPATALLVALSVAALFVGGVAAILQADAKRMFAYSSVGQVGYITLGLALATPLGLTGGLVHLLNHALMKSTLFMALGAVAFRTGGTLIADMAGIGRKMPLAMGAFAVAGLSLIGVPGTVGFVSKWYLILAALDKGWWWLAFLIVASSLLTLIYFGRVVEAAWFRAPVAATMEASDPPLDMLVPLWLLAGLCVYFGLDTRLTVGLAGQAAATLLAGFR